MSVRLDDRSFQYPVGITKNMLVEVGKFTFPADFVILEMEEDTKVPLILGRPFFHTADDSYLERCIVAHLVLNLENSHSWSKKDCAWDTKLSGAGLKLDKENQTFYQHFIKDFSKIARPITKLLEKDAPFEFNDECQKAFKILKAKLTCAPVIVSLNWNLPFELMCDASDFAVGAVLGQKDRIGKNFHPIYFASKTLNPAQQKYTVTEKELWL
ncbi:reverse transcriptase domain-containing protein [Tanacetum coccineum]